MTDSTDLPVVVIGAGPIGLAAAANLATYGVDAIVLESGERPGAAVAQWGHVQLFSPWSELVDPRARRILEDAGWVAPDADTVPTGADWVAGYLEPLAAVLGNVSCSHRVTAVTKSGRDLLVDDDRDATPFVVHVTTPDGPQRMLARAVVDASGTWHGTNPLGSDGVPAAGEVEHADRISYRVPDLADPGTRARYAGRHVVVAGTGASAKTAIVALRALAETESTTITWLMRRGDVQPAFGGEDADELAGRGALGTSARRAVEDGSVTTVTGFHAVAVAASGGRLRVESADGRSVDAVDEIIALTGFRPDLGLLGEVRTDVDPVLGAPRDLAPHIDPRFHSCGSVQPHGVDLLSHPERDLFVVGMKSYGRATSFLALTGFEQVRSVAAHLAGDHEAAAKVDLVLPETGVCGGAGDFGAAADSGCCAAPEPQSLGLTIGVGRPAESS
ncbi:NAD(P)-binding domain-containing protein [Aeromicrobium wangtongii]|uniref:NAD(P)-binding domain-containing protein n=1 Tax=Aeromicrobium wangtongii TaxID=2969247 RepID=A0ABY5M858_9ACTN|nr:NAD(P)-binding domain-containing protein [Aeromicrobium wangtongii]MCD9199666.1 NAD(P)-binding domain-containing protein [Aeromicrobium wangtongii]UUP14017.1 NAD(P)-binding domain-containing protein [Aeromicrobium wangtongii]